jgi:hypothetical protein
MISRWSKAGDCSPSQPWRTKYLPSQNGTQIAMVRRRVRSLRKTRFILKQSGDNPANGSIACVSGWYRYSEVDPEVQGYMIA